VSDVTLFDHTGRPIDLAALTTPDQASSTVSGVRRPVLPSIAGDLTPQRLATILNNAAHGDMEAYLTLAEEMEEREPHYASVLETRKLAISSVLPTVQPASEDQRDVDLAGELADLLRRPEAFELVPDLSDALGKGYAVVEIDWKSQVRGGRRVLEPAGFDWRDPRFFQWDRNTGRELRLRDVQDLVYGLPLTPYRFLIHTPGRKSGLPGRGGLARLVAACFCVKSFAIRDWLALAEIFGIPVRLGRYGPRASDADIRKLINAVVNLGTDAAAVIPDSMKIEFVESSAQGDGRIFATLADYLDKQVSKAVLGQTMTTDSGSSRSQGEVHERAFESGRNAYDLRRMGMTLTRGLAVPYVVLNHGPQERYPSIVLSRPPKVDLEPLKLLPQLIPMGVKVSNADVISKLGLRPPKDEADTLAPLNRRPLP
jgi:phage gp29-like protein